MSEKSTFYNNMNNMAANMIQNSGLTGKKSLADLNTISTDLASEDLIYDDILSATYGIDGTITIPTVTGTSYTYDGTLRSPTITGFDDEYMTKSGDLSATNAGDYSIIVSLKDPVNYQWSDYTQTPKVFVWSIAKVSLEIPTITGSYTYDGTVQSPTIVGYDSIHMSESGDLSATNANDYAIIFELFDVVNYQWSDNTIESKSVVWSIAKATPVKPVLSNSTLNLSEDAPSGTFTVTRSGDGTIMATSSDLTNFSTSVSGTIVTVTALNPSVEATANIVVTIAEGTNYLAYDNTDIICIASVIVEKSAKIYITITQANVSIPICYEQSAANGVIVNWGDDSAEESSSRTTQYGGGSNLDPMYSVCYRSSTNGPTLSYVKHTYTTPGDYVIKLKTASGATGVLGAYGATGSYQSGPTGGASTFGYCLNNTNYPTGLTVNKYEGTEGIGFHVGVYGFANSYSGFYGCTTITEMVLPSDMTSMRGISNCTSLSKITMNATNPPTANSGTFSNVPSDCAIYVPAESVSSYQAASYWGARAAYIQAIPNS